MPRIELFERLAAGAVAIGTILALALGHAKLALGFGVGGMLAIANFVALRTLMRAITRSEHPPKQAMLSVLLMFKFAVMGAAIFLLINFASIDPAGMLLGLSIVVVAILVEGFRIALRGGPAAQE